MPVTAKLSRKFYDTFGDEVTNELVDWLNQVDVTYRADLRELNELNFARSDAKMEQRLAEFEAKLEQRLAGFEAKIERRLAGFEAKIERRLFEQELKFEARFAAIDARFDQLKAELIKWMFVFWAGTTFTILGAMFAIAKL